jgi:NADH dehydrogenase FAD-containing subunit
VRRLLLVGAGHAHLAALRSFAAAPLYGARVTLVAPEPRPVYSGMLPGVIAGHYRLEEALLDLPSICGRGFVEYSRNCVSGLDLEARRARFEGGGEFEYDLISINAGALVDSSLPGAQHALPVKPLEPFLRALNERRLGRIAIVGAGAGGAELGMALRYRGAAVTLYSDRPSLSPALAERVARALRRARVDFRPGMAVTAIEPGPLVIAGATRQEFDLVILATGPTALPWLAGSGLAVDAHGFALVEDTLQSASYPEVFVVGDCATLRDTPHPRSGVYSVRHGEWLAENLRNLVSGKPLEPFVPQPRALALLSCGRRYAIAERGGWTGEGRWAWHWKNWIDRRWVAGLRA